MNSIYGSLRRWSVPGALAIQAVLFSLSHQYGFLYSVFIFVGGILFGIVYEWRRSLWATVSMHLTCNIITVTLLVMAFVAYANTPVLGVALENHDESCRITRVLPDSSSEAAGLKEGDIIASLGDQPIAHPDEVFSGMEQFEFGSEVDIEIIRGGKRITLTVELNQRKRDY